LSDEPVMDAHIEERIRQGKVIICVGVGHVELLQLAKGKVRAAFPDLQVTFPRPFWIADRLDHDSV